jgi:hypothetical protein
MNVDEKRGWSARGSLDRAMISTIAPFEGAA